MKVLPKKQSASIVRKLLCWLVVIQPRSIWKVQFSFLLYYTIVTNDDGEDEDGIRYQTNDGYEILLIDDDIESVKFID